MKPDWGHPHAILGEPTSWLDELRVRKPLYRGSMFWSCVMTLLLALVDTTGVIVRLSVLDKSEARILVPLLVVLEAYCLYLGYRFWKVLQKVRHCVSNAGQENLLYMAVFSARLFMFGTGALGVSMMVTILVFNRS
jgi:hypothetical protein